MGLLEMLGLDTSKVTVDPSNYGATGQKYLGAAQKHGYAVAKDQGNPEALRATFNDPAVRATADWIEPKDRVELSPEAREELGR